MFYILHGEDEFSRAEQVAAFKEKIGDATVRDFNVTVLDGRKATLAELRLAADAVPFLADKRLVVVEGLLARLGAGKGGKGSSGDELSGAAREFIAQLIDYLPQVPDSTRLVFVEARTLPPSNPILKLAASQPGKTVLAFAIPKNPVPWIEKRALLHGGRIDRKAASKLAQVIGSDLRRLDSEIQKLITYVNAARPIGEDDVARLVSPSIEANIFDLVDALGRRDGRRAMGELHRLLDLGENSLGLLAMITRQFRLLIQIKELQEKNVPAPEMAKTLGQHPFVIDKIGQQARNFSMEQLERIYVHLLDVDVGIKTGEVGDVLALDLLVAELAG
ncbi:MAG TPA: DNA polymerase III subunit delta [Anaerolineae bacterium]|nr:DNA polymerase III subunit delta [Anaerolineae bacterium]